MTFVNKNIKNTLNRFLALLLCSAFLFLLRGGLYSAENGNSGDKNENTAEVKASADTADSKTPVKNAAAKNDAAEKVTGNTDKKSTDESKGAVKASPEKDKTTKPSATDKDKSVKGGEKPATVKTKTQGSEKEKPQAEKKPEKPKRKPGAWDVAQSPLRFWVEVYKDNYFGGTGKIFLPSGWLDEEKVHVAVVTADGKRVGSQIIWQKKGEKVEIAFDASANAKLYQVYMDEKEISGAPKWEPDSGVIIEVRKGLGRHVYDFKKALDLWNENTALITRNLTARVFHGTIERAAPDDMLVKYRGYINIDEEGDYYFSTMSEDASFVVIDGKLVTSWGGPHSVWGGRYGEHKGKVKLGKGRHLYEYYNVYVDGRFCAAAGWTKPGKKGVSIIEEADFGKISRYRLIKAEAKNPEKNPLIIDWSRIDSVIVTESTGDAFVEMGFNLLRTNHAKSYNPFSDPKKILWTFDGGYNRRGASVSLVMPAALVKVEVKGEGISLQRVVNVMADWNTWEKWSGKRYHEAAKKFRSSDLGGAGLDDLLAVSALAVPVDNSGLANAVALRIEKLKDINLAYDELKNYNALIDFISGSVLRDYPRAKALCERGLASIRKNKLSGVDVTGLKIIYAKLLLEVWGRSDDVAKLIRTDKLTEVSAGKVEFRQAKEAQMLLAKVFLLENKLDDALTLLKKLSPDLEGAKLEEMKLKRRGKIQSCEVWLAKGEFKNVVDAIIELREENPLELLNTESILLLSKCYFALEEYDKAYFEVLAGLNTRPAAVATSGLLYQAALAAVKTGRVDEAKKYKEILVKSYPQTYAGARAKELDIEDNKK